MNTSHSDSEVATLGLRAAAILVALSSTSLAQIAPFESRRVYSWEQLGPMPGAGLDVWRLADTPADPNRIYAGTSGGLSVSYDRGLTWQLRSPVKKQRGYYSDVAASPGDADIVLQVTFDKGKWRSVDGGLTWSRPTAPPASPYLSDPVFGQSAGGIVYVGTWDGIARSFDNGDTFAQVLSGAGFLYGIVVDYANPFHLYVMDSGVGIQESFDGGFNWTVKSFPAGGSSSTIAIDPADGDRIMVGHGGSVYVSTDGGDTWSTPGTGLSNDYLDVVAFDPDDPNRLYAGVRAVGFALSGDGGATWTVSGDPELDRSGGFPGAILASRFDPDLVLLGDTGGVFRSTDEGQTFERRNDGLEQNAAVRALQVDPFQPDHMVATTGGSAFWTDDAGLSWTESVGLRNFQTMSLAVDAVNPDRYYAATWAGELWRSDDCGRNFYSAFAHTGNAYFFEAVAHPTVGGRIFATGNRLWRSDDGGLSFVNAGVPDNWLWTVAISPANPDVMYCSGFSTVHHSDDGGATWAAALTPPGHVVRGLYADPVDPNRAYASAPAGEFYRTDDAGENWTVMAGVLGNSETCIAPAFDPGHLIVNSYDDVRAYSSRDAGATAAVLGPGPGAPITSFAESPSRVFAGTSGAGVVRLGRE